MTKGINLYVSISEKPYFILDLKIILLSLQKEYFIMKGKGFLLIILLLIPLGISAQKYDIDRALNDLEKAIDNRQTYIQHQQNLINKTKHESAYTAFADDQYIHNKKIFHLYKKFDSDSAISYAQRNYDLGVAYHREDWQKEALLNVARVQISRGVLFISRDILEKCGPIDSFPKELQAALAMAILNYNNKMKARPIYKGSIADIKNTPFPESWSALQRYFKQGSLQYYNALNTFNIYHPEYKKSVRQLLTETRHDDWDSRGKIYMLLSKYQKNEGDMVGYHYYLIQAAICDLKQVNRSSNSLLSLLESPLVQKNINLAYKLAMVCEEDAKAFKDYNRSVNILSAQDVIIKSYQTLRNRQRALLVGAFVVMLILCVIITSMFIILRKKSIRQKITNLRLDTLYHQEKEHLDQIKAMSDELEKNNEQLHEELKRRDKNFISTYYLCSDYIKVHLNFKKSIINLLKTNSYKEALQKAKSTDINETELKNFYRKFDEAFLSIHVDFVERFNKLLIPEGKFHLEDSATLTPELRIYALISLGINNSVNIADFLHYSPQTIYNYRLKVRHLACIEEKDFTKAVADLYDDSKLKRYFE